MPSHPEKPTPHLPKRLGFFLTLVVVGLLLAVPRPARAYPLLLWPSSLTSPGTGLVVPFVFVSGDVKTLNPYLYGAVGLSERFDIIAGASGVFGLSPASASFGLVDVSARYLATPELALTPRILYTPGQSLVVSPELHATRSFGNLMLTLNAGVRPMLDLNGGGLTSATGFAYLSGSYFLSKQLWLVLEADPSVTFARGTDTAGSSWSASVLLAPGVGFALNPEQTHIFELAALVSLPTSAPFQYATSVTYALWYATSFTLWEK
ncbi:hypothetical protein [Archangium lansingense]|uniref:Uncharacterized protein n=1 Tax=Archangium lansingense TaxID=2995310 RepID=A0ABT4AHZ8_9BACT|nr:hypothetical protein [Archangium lansinium]MCY1080824.1 hypothetical protein [Archangium lansinium]